MYCSFLISLFQKMSTEVHQSNQEAVPDVTNENEENTNKDNHSSLLPDIGAITAIGDEPAEAQSRKERQADGGAVASAGEDFKILTEKGSHEDGSVEDKAPPEEKTGALFKLHIFILNIIHCIPMIFSLMSTLFCLLKLMRCGL